MKKVFILSASEHADIMVSMTEALMRINGILETMEKNSRQSDLGLNQVEPTKVYEDLGAARHAVTRARNALKD